MTLKIIFYFSCVVKKKFVKAGDAEREQILAICNNLLSRRNFEIYSNVSCSTKRII